MDEQQPFALPLETEPETPQFAIGDKVSCTQVIGKTTYGPYNFTIDKILPVDKGGIIRVSGLAQDKKRHTVPQKICKKGGDIQTDLKTLKTNMTTPTGPVTPLTAPLRREIPIAESPDVPEPPAPIPVAPGASGTGLLPEAPVAETRLPAVAPPPVPPPVAAPPTETPPATAEVPPAVPAAVPLPAPSAGPVTVSDIPDLQVSTAPLGQGAPETWTWTPVPNLDRNTFQDLLDQTKAGEVAVKIAFPNDGRIYYLAANGDMVSIEYINLPYFISTVATDLPQLKPWFARGGRTYRKKNKKNKKTLRVKKH